MEEMVPMKTVDNSSGRVEELMDKVLDVKLMEFEARLDRIESEQNIKGSETVKHFKKFSEKLDQIAAELKEVEKALHSEETVVEKIRSHEQDAVSNVRAWEKKTVTKVKKQLQSPKFFKKIRTELANRKFKESLIRTILSDVKLRKLLVDRLARETSTKLKKQKITSKVAKVAAKKVLKTVKPKVGKAARKAAKKAAKTAVKAAAA